MHSECIRCGKMTSRAYQARTTCIFCIEYYKLADAYAVLEAKTMTDEDMLKLDAVRSICHGGAAAVALAMEGQGKLNMKNVLEMLRDGSKNIVEVTEHYGGWRRISKLKGIT